MPAAVVQGNPNNRRSKTPSTSSTTSGARQFKSAPWVTQRSAMTRRLNGQEVPGIHEPKMIIALGIAAARERTEELLLGLAHRP